MFKGPKSQRFVTTHDDFRKPILEGKGATDYERYIRTDDLLSLQTPIDHLSHPDELTFQVVHQSSELVMKGAAWELERARIKITEGDCANAARLMRRANAMLEHPISLLHILETITPYDYHIIRAGLGHGSGLDSPGFLALLHITPRIGDAFHQLLNQTGVSYDDIYRRHEEFFGLHDVAERMLDFDERMQAFRFHHLKLAQRIIGGGVIGTMGTPVEVLHQRMQHLAFRELWELRNQITEKQNTSPAENKTTHQP
ncbi:MAG TPA: tryptophan 2,3-dioxygenase family protein [Candidatus Angelobacter sp.]|nr:tryptophan 2,3-dioxygenase family protein [Candidatus Angelobacter sp.]